MPQNNMDLLASILDQETAQRATAAGSADVAAADENKSNKKQKLDNDSDGNGENRVNFGIDTGTPGASMGADASEPSNALGAKLDAVVEATGASVPTVATGIKALNDGGRGADEKMDIDTDTTGQAANSQISEETTTKTPNIIHPRTTTESVVKEIIASPEYRKLLEGKDQERLSAQPVTRQVVHRPPIPGLDISTPKAPEKPASRNVVSDTTVALPPNSSPKPTSKLSSVSESGSVPFSPSRSQAMSTTTTTATATAPTPIPTGRARTSEYINRLYHLCATEGLEAPVFDFDTVAFAPVSLFTAKLTVAGLIVGSNGVESPSPIGGKKGGVDLGIAAAASSASSASTTVTADGETDSSKAGEKGAFKSKREAKEAAAEYGYMALTRFINEGIIGKKASNRAGLGEEVQKQQEMPKENWIGLLQEFCSKTGTRNPVSQEYALGTRFACETFISQRNKGNNSTGNASISTAGESDPSIDGIPFGGRDKLFPNKKAARQNAAFEAITWLKENGYYSTATGKPVARPDKGGHGGSHENADDGVGEESRFVGMKKGMSYGQMVAEYCHLLVLPQPEYQFENTPNAPPGFLSGAAFFLDHPEFDGPVGEIRNIYGKKAAKQECARRVAEILSDMLAEERGLK